MARVTPRRRLDLSSGEEEAGWTRVEKKRRRQRTPPPATPGHRLYRVVGQTEATAFQALRRLEREHPDLRVRVWERFGGETRVKPLDEAAAFFLARAAREPAFGISLAEVEGKSRGVVLRYPVAQSLDPILADPRVTFARRLTYSAGHGRREPTRQVEVSFRGPLPETLDLGFWGVFSVRRFNPEPLRCFKCHAFGHVQKYCRQQAICGVCSGKHSTSQCIDALRAGVSRAARCVNCGKAHHAWSRACPARLRRLPPRPARDVIDTSPPEPAAPKAAPCLPRPPPVQKPEESSSSGAAPRALQDAATQCAPPPHHDAVTQTCKRKTGRAAQTDARPAREAGSQTLQPAANHAGTSTETSCCEAGTQTPAPAKPKPPPPTPKRHAATSTPQETLVVTRDRLRDALQATILLYRHRATIEAHGVRLPYAADLTLKELIADLPLSRQYPPEIYKQRPEPKGGWRDWN